MDLNGLKALLSNAATVGCNIPAEVDGNVFVKFDDDVEIVEKLTDQEIITETMKNPEISSDSENEQEISPPSVEVRQMLVTIRTQSENVTENTFEHLCKIERRSFDKKNLLFKNRLTDILNIVNFLYL